MKKLFLTLLILIGFVSPAQVELRGFVSGGDDGEPVPNVYVVNVNSLEHVLTNVNGYFSLQVEPGDSLVFSHLSFNYTYYQVEDSITDGQVEVFVMEPKNYLLDEVSVMSYKYSTNKPRPMVLEEPNVPDPENVSYPTQQKPGLSSPADLLYWYFGSRPRQLRELQRLQEEDAYRVQLRQASNREILMGVTGLTSEELEALAFSCKFGDTPIQTTSDYDLLVSILNCYQSYIAELEQQRVLEDAESGWGE